MSEFHCSQNDKNFSSQEDFSRQDDALRQENSQEQSPAGIPIPTAVEVVFLEALSGDALRVGLSVSEAHAPERSGTATGRVPAVVYLWGIQAPRPGQPFGAAATEAAGRICGGKRLHVAARSAGPEGRITGSVVAEETGSPGEDTTGKGSAGKGSGGDQDVGRALIRLGLAWQDQRGPSSARLRSLEQKARREEVGLWQRADPIPPWAWRE
ncbi:endonuclease YncB(thermonuclease family) [Salinibacter ruber]|uniref:thermonuclease family protein n=1 Tax=Salinibacter ruber TaxID=146919 RepID=UPI00216A92A4|nr:thermonuclease family protein [Salinibacter ruber]MCS3675261.1 endonuclease YncB(thermonuclease family) [Salinibacter ruber]